jgi:hypothetical protein
MKQYCVYTRDTDFGAVLDWLGANSLNYEVHLNRTRFWVPENHMLTDFLLRFCHCCKEVDELLL